MFVLRFLSMDSSPNFTDIDSRVVFGFGIEITNMIPFWIECPTAYREILSKDSHILRLNGRHLEIKEKPSAPDAIDRTKV
ncbi:hypothetical protein Vi05172_g13425 [Venturia inaequalis]|nr:hypothetical protein Vi05172_g13425 [Venturia inaequalis]